VTAITDQLAQALRGLIEQTKRCFALTESEERQKVAAMDDARAALAARAALSAAPEQQALPECEACMTPDACVLRGMCAHYLREQYTPTHVATAAPEPLNIAELARRFLTWPLPDSVCADSCACEPGKGHRRGIQRMGTHLLSDTEARAMLEHVLEDTGLMNSAGKT
jgi:hypothetical protein